MPGSSHRVDTTPTRSINFTGYRGRTGLFEIMVLNEPLRDLILDQVPLGRLRAAAREEGMVPLRTAGLKAIYDGITTVEEVVRETFLGG